MKSYSPARLAKLARSKDPLIAANAREGLDQLKSDIKLARKYFNGYSGNKFDLRRVASLSSATARQLRKTLQPLRGTLASNFTINKAPKTKASKEALEKLINRKIPKNAKAIPIGVSPNSKVVIETRGKRASVRVERKLSSGGIWREQTWYFSDYHDVREHASLDTEKGANDAYSAMMASGDIPKDGWYVLVTGAYGSVGSPNTMLGTQEMMAELFNKYETEPGKVEQFIGVRLVGFSYMEAMVEYEPRYAARIARKKQRKALKQRLRKLRENRV